MLVKFLKSNNNRGGREFTDPDIGVGHSGYTAKDPDKQTVKNASRLINLAGVWGASPSSMWSGWKDGFDNFTNTYNLIVDGTAELNDVMKPYLNNDTTDWFLNSDGRTSNIRTIPKDSPRYP